MYPKQLLHTLVRLWNHPRLDRREIISFQEEKLRYLLRHAARCVGHYRSLFEAAGIGPRDIRTAADLAFVPMTTKNDLRAHPPSGRIADGIAPNRLIAKITSGSSGRPFVVRRTRLEEHVINMFRIRAHRAYGKRLRDRTARLVAASVPGEKRSSDLTRLRLRLGIYRDEVVDCLLPDAAICRRLDALDPDILSGYPSAIAHLAPFANERFSFKKLRQIVCGGETLTSAKRRAIETGFGVPVRDILGCHECNIVAWECPTTGLYHICDDNVVAEVLRGDRPVEDGEKGELVITALHSYAMPFVRYRTGDVVVKGPRTCPCGEPFSTLRGIEGRVREYFRLPDGRWIHPLTVVMSVICDLTPWMDQFQMVQETETDFTLRVSPLTKITQEDVGALQASVADKLGPGTTVRMEVLDHIPFEPSGKFKDCVCLLTAEDDVGISAQGRTATAD